MGFCELLTLIFVILKATGTIHWSWWIVFIPMYPAIVFYIIFLIFFSSATIQMMNIYKKKDL